MSEINVTPMVDVMLVLLIIFMVTAPLLATGVQVDLPLEHPGHVAPRETADAAVAWTRRAGPTDIGPAHVRGPRAAARRDTVSRVRC